MPGVYVTLVMNKKESKEKSQEVHSHAHFSSTIKKKLTLQ